MVAIIATGCPVNRDTTERQVWATPPKLLWTPAKITAFLCFKERSPLESLLESICQALSSVQAVIIFILASKQVFCDFTTKIVCLVFLKKNVVL